MSTQVFNISLSNMQAAFDRMEHEAGWDIQDKLYWGYYFLDNDLNRLQLFGKKLEKEGFQIAEVRNSGQEHLFLLHAEERRVHSAQSLFEQCHKLAKLAQENAIEVFDGWDVEKFQMSEGLVE